MHILAFQNMCSNWWRLRFPHVAFFDDLSHLIYQFALLHGLLDDPLILELHVQCLEKYLLANLIVIAHPLKFLGLLDHLDFQFL